MDSWRELTSFPRHWVPCCPLGTVMAFHWDTSHPPSQSVLSELFAEDCDELSMDPTLWADLIPLLRSCWEWTKHVKEFFKDFHLPLPSLHLTWAPRVQRLEEEERETGCLQ